jgi:glycerophosphoryl diester phosphodiesterase
MALSQTASKGAKLKRLPQTIAHRGHKAAFPENTLGAFRGAVEVGSHAIETDVHLSKDGVVVLSHVGYTSFQKWLVQAHVGGIVEIVRFKRR